MHWTKIVSWTTCKVNGSNSIKWNKNHSDLSLEQKGNYKDFNPLCVKKKKAQRRETFYIP